jgi:sorbose reductase
VGLLGGTRGIGLAIARALAEAGADIAIVYRSASDAAATATTIASANSVRCLAYQCDVADMTAVDDMVGRVVADFGGIDIMVANAGVAYEFDAVKCTPEQLSQTMRVNFDGAFWCARKVADHWKQTSKFGNVIFTTSMSAMVVNIPDHQAIVSTPIVGCLHLSGCGRSRSRWALRQI